MAGIGGILVSTHSRPKAAGNHIAPRKGRRKFQHTAARRRLGPNPPTPLRGAGFNTQPPEGGWLRTRATQTTQHGFQHTAARRRLVMRVRASRRLSWFQHTAARRRLEFAGSGENFAGAVSTHSRPKAAGFNLLHDYQEQQCFNTQPPEGGWFWTKTASRRAFWFQHTAARRRLDRAAQKSSIRAGVSTHSRPKAAG